MRYRGRSYSSLSLSQAVRGGGGLRRQQGREREGKGKKERRRAFGWMGGRIINLSSFPPSQPVTQSTQEGGDKRRQKNPTLGCQCAIDQSVYVRVCVRERIPVHTAGIKDIDLLSYVRGECTCTYAHLSSPACAKKRGGACFCIFLIACTSGRRDVNVVRAQIVFIIFRPKEEKKLRRNWSGGERKMRQSSPIEREK